MKKLIFMIMVFLFTISSAMAADSCTVKMVQSFLENNELGYASQCVEEIIIREPGNAYAHFLKGKVCLEKGDFNCAKKKFAAEPVKRKYFEQITNAYRDKAEEFVKNGQIHEAKVMYLEAAEREPRFAKEACDVFYYYGNAQFGQSAFPFYNASREFCGEHSAAMGERILQMARQIKKQMNKEERKKYIEEAVKYASKEAVEAVFPPPTWQTVFKQMYVGKGYGEDDYLLTVKFGEELKNGDKLIITGFEFEDWDNGRWNKHSDTYETINQNSSNNGKLGVRAPLGESFTVEIKRLTDGE